eukprot:GFYU01002843.1.p1 GENE.GFYU01002843.1~~GFYU01002843.1.p1  ORF type:complete len:476 (+),score=158.73 GFYU01002843.1:50-1477(+)
MVDLSAVDFFRKIPRDLTQGTFSGGSISIVGACVMVVLFFLELSSFLTVNTTTRVVFEEREDEDLQINFNITLPKLACRYAGVDVADHFGVHHMNITKDIKKTRLDYLGRDFAVVQSDPHYGHDIFEGDEHEGEHSANENFAVEIESKDQFERIIREAPLVLVNFYAPWCPWSQRLKPTWEHVAGVIQGKRYRDAVKLIKADCTKMGVRPVCMEHHIGAFPTVRIIQDHEDHQKPKPGGHMHDDYHGDRSKDHFIKWIDHLVEERGVWSPPPEQPKAEAVNGVTEKVIAGPEGCRVEGHVVVKRVPGNFHIASHGSKQSLDPAMLNLSHKVNHLSFGEPLSQGDKNALPSGEYEKMNRISGQLFSNNDQANITIEHYIKVVGSTYHILSGKQIAAYKFTSNTHLYTDSELASAMFTYDISPLEVITVQEKMPFYHFLTSVCAIIGGMFTVIGLIDSVVFHGGEMLRQKIELGKQI